jgi:hypothetical protein
MEEKEIFLVVFVQGSMVISEVKQVISELGEPDCKLINPYLIGDKDISPWLEEYTNTKEIMISSDKILTLVEPKGYLLDQYLEKTK